MIRFFHAYFPTRTVVLVISEACLVAAAFVTATLARLGPNDATLLLSYERGAIKILAVSAAFLTCMYYFDLYDSSILNNAREVLVRLATGLGTMCVLLAVAYYMYPPLELGRGIFGIGFLILCVLVVGWRWLFLAVNSRPQFAQRALILGEGPLAASLVHELETRPELGLRVVAQLSPAGMRETHADEPPEEKAASFTPGQQRQLQSTVDSFRVSRIVIVPTDRDNSLPLESLIALKSRGVLIQDGAAFYEAVTGKVPIDVLHLKDFLYSDRFHLSRFLMGCERIMSFSASLAGLILSLPLLPFIVLAIKLTSEGPVLYRQERVGRDGVVFNCYKFRTMWENAEADIGPTWADDNDPRITPVGKWLRLSRLDEIPQVWNVLRGDMSLIGPRPERPEFVEWLSREIPLYRLRHAVRPGITGWAQVRYKYGNSIEDAKEKLRYDLFYIKNMSPGLDLMILFHTTKTILLGRGAK